MMDADMEGNGTSFGELLLAELKLDPCQWEERPSVELRRQELADQCLEIHCLVHNDWLLGLSEGHLSHPLTPTMCQEEIHWLLQPSSHSAIPKPWQRLHVSCVRKPRDPGGGPRMLVPQCRSYSLGSIHEFLTQISQETMLSSWREIVQLLQQGHQQREPSGGTLTRLVTSAFVRQLVRRLYNVELKSLDKGVTDTLQSDTSTTERLKELMDTGVHANLTPLLAAFESQHAFYLVFPYLRFTLFDAIMHSPAMLEDSVAKPLFVMFQLLQLLDHCHNHGLTLGELGLKNIFIDSRLWVQVRLPASIICSDRHKTNETEKVEDETEKVADEVAKGEERDEAENITEDSPVVAVASNDLKDEEHTLDSQMEALASEELSTGSGESGHPGLVLGGSTNTLTDTGEENAHDQKTSRDYGSKYVPPALGLCDAVKKWRHGELSNFDYLMVLNYHAGRCLGEPNNHPIFPWVMEFTNRNSNFRDLSKSKHRLVKGDRQLDFTYISALEEMRRILDQESLIPHHIGDISSDVTYYVYMARRTPKEVLCSRVRPRWVPEEYPSSIEKMYIWSPDECIPEYFADPLIFKSIHPDLPDLAIPMWCSSHEELIAVHRGVLESDLISSQIHNWIDLFFGYKLSGNEAVKAKNVYLSLVDKHTNPMNCGIVQLFRSPHPKRIQSSSAPLALFEWQSQLNLSSVMNVTAFSINQECQRSSGDAMDGHQTPESSHPKTLESILKKQTSSTALSESPQGDRLRRHSLEDDSSFEYVTLPDELQGKTPNVIQDTLGIDYGSTPAIPSTQKLKESVVLNSVSTPGNRFRVYNYIFRQRRTGETPTEVSDSQIADVALPKDSNVLHQLSKLEELAHFVTRSCKGYGRLFEEQWEPDDLLLLQGSHQRDCVVLEALTKQRENSSFLPSFEERVAIDISAVACTMIEICCIKHLRASLPAHASLLERMTTIRRLMKSGQLHIPRYLVNLVDFVINPENNKFVFDDLKPPSLSASLLMQSFIPIVSFPEYFNPLYKFLHRLEQLCRETPISGRDHAGLVTQEMVLNQTSELSSGDLNMLMGYISQHLEKILTIVSSEGFPVILSHIFPFFQYPETSFEAVNTCLDALGKYMSRRNIERLFSAPVIRLFDSPIEPYQREQVLNRTMADIIIKRFGLSTFLRRFLGFIMDAVVEPMRISPKGINRRMKPRVFSMKSESAMTLVQSDFFQSARFDERNTPQIDFTFSFALSEGPGGYDSDKEEYSSVDSDTEYPPEASILAKSGVAFGISTEAADSGSRPLSMYSDMDDRDETDLGHDQARDDEASLRPELSLPREYSNPTVSLPRERHSSTMDDSSGIIPNNHEKLHTTSSLKIDTSSTEYRPSLGSPGMTQSITSSMFSESSQDVASPVLPKSSYHRQTSLTLGRLSIDNVLREGEEESEDEQTFETESMCSADPQTIAINIHISQVAADCLCWLARRLGPLLTTKHLTRPLLDNLHRCFTGILHLRGREAMAIKCLGAIGKLYGEMMIIKLYLPYAENLVFAATTRMTVKSEAGLAASLALTKLSIQLLSDQTLDFITMDVCDNYLIPMIQLLSSQTIFPSGGKARAAICHSVVHILKEIGKRLGREKSTRLLIETLQCFFTCFDSIHRRDLDIPSKGLVNGEVPAAKKESDGIPVSNGDATLGSPTKVVPMATDVESHPLSLHGSDSETDEDDNRQKAGGTSRQSSTLIEETEVYKQLCTTFSPAMAHAAYIPFCLLLGQIKLNCHLYNTDLIEQIAYGHDKVAQPNSPLPTVLETLDKDDTSDESSGSEHDDTSDDEDDRNFAMMTVVHNKSGLAEDAARFGRSSWFVELEKIEGEEGGVGKTEEVVEGQGNNWLKNSLGAVGLLQQFWQNRSSSDEFKSDSLGRHSANFDAKFSGVQVQSPTEGKQVSSSTSAPSFDELDCSLAGNWSNLWESQLNLGPYMYNSYTHFRALKLQTFGGHKGAIKSLAVADSEHYFASGSKDKTVKIWTLRNHGDGSTSSTARYTYCGHQKPVVAVELLEAMDNVVSCDGSVHLWDTETGYCIHQFSSPRNAQFLAMKVLPPPQPLIALATSDLQLRFIDIRAKSFQHLWKLQFPYGGYLKAVVCSDNWIAVGNNNGRINTMDLRTGEVLATWKPTEVFSPQTTAWNESLLQLKATKRGNLISSVGSGVLSLWKPTHGRLTHHIRGQTSHTYCLDIIGEQLISATANGQVVVHNSFEITKDSSSTLTRIRSRELKAAISSLAVLPENQLLLFGSDNGHIVLMA